MTNILENKSNYLIIKEDNYIKLFSYKSLVSKYNLLTNELELLPYTFININGNSSSSSKTTSRHLNKFKKYITDNYQYYINK